MNRYAMAAAALFAVSACGDDSEPDVFVVPDAEQTFEMAILELMAGVPLALSLGDAPEEPSVVYTCTDGGTITIPTVQLTDSISCTVGGSTETSYEADYSVTAVYEDCTVGRLTINGALDYDVDTDQSAVRCTSSGTLVGPITRRTMLMGRLELDGDVNGTCDIDMSWTATSTGASSYTGTICGYDAEEIVTGIEQ